ncbi:hypothetical protein MFS40622_1121 [Methanocaldococcus sp. FS406-22]|uniref:hypothetical protein n=1 Tax=Methanocaldococcus sp. (strain FS406-22) TaxID=644281 RepID=UPI0001BF3508|nr:hypothetical protein [Methanocaldococcus sp. FS406-22]ADC69801.1 hypothetical protein MFS40622_1121 [Methanocaldococcus sp. FS406-22]
MQIGVTIPQKKVALSLVIDVQTIESLGAVKELVEEINKGIVVDFDIFDKDGMFIKIQNNGNLYEIWKINKEFYTVSKNGESICEIDTNTQNPAGRLLIKIIDNLFNSLEDEVRQYLKELKLNVIRR